MSNIRYDRLTGDYVIIAKERANRPIDIASVEVNCPFCPGNEHLTPDETFVKNEDGNWSLRAFLNKYPTVEMVEGEQLHDIALISQGYGRHELLIDTPNHNEMLHEYSDARLNDVLLALQNRAAALETDENIKYIQVFKNSGENAGASKHHSHWQIVALPILPQKQKLILKRSMAFQKEYDKCLLCDIVETELLHKERIIEDNGLFVAVSSYAAKFTFEVSIFPKEHIHSLVDFNKAHIKALASLLKNTVKRIAVFLDNAPYNIIFMDQPINCKDFSDWHWHLQILPRYGRLAGFELATGCNINVVEPEYAAKALKEVKLI